MDIRQLIDGESIFFNVQGGDKYQVLENISRLAAKRFDLDETAIFDVICEREGLSSTVMENGVALPHGRVKGVSVPMAVLAKLDSTMEGADLVFMLLAPEQAGADHLESLAAISAVIKDKTALDKIRTCKNRQDVYKILTA